MGMQRYKISWRIAIFVFAGHELQTKIITYYIDIQGPINIKHAMKARDCVSLSQQLHFVGIKL